MALSEYTQLEYIESTGTQYIDTAFKPNQDTTCEVSLYKNTNNSCRIFGAWSTSYHENTFSIGTDGPDNSYIGYDSQYDGSDNGKKIPTIPNGNHIVGLYKNIYKLDSNIIKTYNYQNFTCTKSIYLFVQHTHDGALEQYGAYRLYYCKIWDNNTLVRNMIPVKRKSDNVLGLYDKVNNVFYMNRGTGNFIAGPAVYDGSQLQQNILEIQDLMKQCNDLSLDILGGYTPPPTGYTKLEYIESSRTQFIDTGVSTGVNIGFEIDFQVMDTRREDAYFGARNSGVSPSRYGCLNYNGGFHMMLSGNSIWNYTVDTTRHKCSIMFNGNSYTAVFDNKQSTGTLSPTNSGNFGLFGYEFPSRDEHPRSAMRLYSVKLYTNNTTLVRDLIPVKRNEDNVICLYDKVSNTYYLNRGTGNFIAGPVKN